MKNRYFKFNFCSFLIFSLFIGNLAFSKPNSDYLLDHKRDQAGIEKGHIQDKEIFFNKRLKIDGNYNVEKIEEFILHLKAEKKSLASDLYETELIEKLELDIKKFKKAKKNALKELNEKKSNLLISYNEYLIPLMESLKEKVESGETKDKCDGIVDEFAIVYASYYLPNAPRNMWDQDINPFNLIDSVFGYSFKKDDEDKIEANNLIVEEDNIEAVKKCLQKDVTLNQYLSNSDLSVLRKCSFDISKLNPGKNPLWTNLKNDQMINEAKNLHQEWFPQEDETIYFSKMKYSSANSPKFNAYFRRNGEKIKIKIKVGIEPHQEVATSILGRLIGMSHDPLITRKKVKVYLDDDLTLDGLKAMWERKYRNKYYKEFATFLHSHGTDEKGEWVVVRDAAIERKDPRKIRLAPYHPVGWDLQNRREHRSLVLWYGLVNMFDTKAGNHRINLIKTDDGYIPEYSMTDVGYSLNGMINLRHPYDSYKAIESWGVNTYNEHLLSWNEDKVTVQWMDVMLDRKKFQTTTFLDIKWMARKIAKISHENIQYAFQSAGMPPEVADLYIHKLTHRRNEIVKAFKLEEEFGLYEVPDLASYSPNENVKNGKVVVNHFDGYVNYERSRMDITPRIFNILGQSFSFDKFKMDFLTTINDKITLDVKGREDINDPKKSSNISYSAIHAGFKISINRSVSLNTQIVNYSNSTQAYVVKDRLSFEFGLDNSLIADLIDHLPLSIRANIKVLSKEIEFVHFAPTWLKGYTSEIKLIKILAGFKKFVTFGLDHGEVLKVYDRFGIGAGVNTSYTPTVEGLKVSLGANISWDVTDPIYFARDSFGQLLVYKARNNTFSIGANIRLAEIKAYVATLTPFSFSYKFQKIHQDATLMKFKMPAYSISIDALDLAQRKRDFIAFEKFLEGNDDLEDVVNSRMDLDANGYRHQTRLSFLLFFKDEVDEGYSQATVNLNNGLTRKFHRYFIEDYSYIGEENTNLPVPEDMTVLSREFEKVAVEMDEEEPEEMVVLIEVGDYHRKMSKKQLLSHIDSLNLKFSKSDDQKFFRDYILPSEEEVDVYRKLYTHLRIFVSGRGVYKSLNNMSKENFKKLKKKYNTDLVTSYKFSKITRLKKYLDNNKKNYDNEELIKKVVQAVSRLKIQKNGIKMLREIFGDKNIFVMGEIYGVYPSFMTMQQNEATTNRRFAGKSWGKYSVTPPIRKFMKKNYLLPDSNFIEAYDTDFIFGELPRTRSVPFY